ncbi:RHS repeat-associated core domain-containing protein [Agromyces aerolatus]|uniref:RHS repeat-associated core domain-containing protein n=1 Tax=Agromyces sp. LY-1074 TaxID=3074080 RepID=UPI0028648830|nr:MULTISPECIES: RHS repeat-associated core domain-containing protein [unclassified Agromyces]MDR5699564.1 RHS repeat-associated core domain-containing protein [Agromyces sp. LY-1074]MDR5705860.1 RHS repeat-associated core domain-containing protein [Agromyces sp. LY-1358]
MLRADPCRVDRQRGRRGWYLAAGAGLCAALVGGLVSPAWAAAPPDGGGDVQLGSFALGDGLEGAIGELDGSFSFSISAGGVLLAWDSRAAAADPVRLGGGWSFGLSTIQVSGGVWVHPVSGGAFPMSATSPSGLAGYPGSDVVFAAAEPGAVVPARPDGSGPETPYAYVLHELGGVSTYYDAAGHPVSSMLGERRSTTEYDEFGNAVASAEGDRYVYDAASRVIAQTTQEGLQIDTSYWADGSRREHTTAAGSTRYYWDGEALLNDSHQATDGASGTASYLTGTSRQARTVQPDGASPSTSYYGTDRHGNVTELIDEAGAITTRYTYTDYGVATAAGDRSAPLPGGIGELGYNPFQYAGEYTYRDGTQPLGPRIYDTAQARFLTEDDASLVNLYAFGDLNPITKVDPSGRTSVLDWARSGAVTAGFAFALLGAALFVSSAFTGGISGLGAVGIFSGLVAGGDAVLAGFEFAAITGKVEWVDQHAVEIASWAYAATSAALAIGGVFTRIGTSLNWKLPMSEVDEIISLENTIQKRVASLDGIDPYLDGLPVGYEDLSYLSTKLEVHSALAKTYTQDIRAMGTIAAPGDTVTLTPTQRLTLLRGLDAEIVSRGKAIRAELDKATKALTGSELSNDPTRTVKQDLANLKTARGKADGVIDPNSGTLEQVGHADDIPDELTGNTNAPTTFGIIPTRTGLNVGGDPFN